jgi:3-deoxy-D-manno-octulosonic-acid transferase
VNSIRPDLVIFIKYDFWYYYLIELKRRKIPVVFVSSLFRSDQFYFHRAVGFMRKALSSVNHFFVQDIKSKNLLSTIGISQTTVAGDTRLDRVVSQSKEQISYPIVESFVEGERVILFGSVWPSDMDVCLEFIKLNIQKFKFIIAPHNLKDKEIVALLKLPKSFKYSAPPVDSGEQKVMVIDNYGMLSSLYRYATIAYVGGGFNGTLHNTMEAAVYEIPVIWGKHLNNEKFLEAKGLIDCGAGYEVSNREDLLVAFQYLEDVEIYKKNAKAAKKYVSDRTGATKKIMLKIEEILC